MKCPRRYQVYGVVQTARRGGFEVEVDRPSLRRDKLPEPILVPDDLAPMAPHAGFSVERVAKDDTERVGVSEHAVVESRGAPAGRWLSHRAWYGSDAAAVNLLSLVRSGDIDGALGGPYL